MGEHRVADAFRETHMGSEKQDVADLLFHSFPLSLIHSLSLSPCLADSRLFKREVLFFTELLKQYLFTTAGF